ncbi:DUF3592 domain-containing protein [Promicromonospora citrea]|nr:DUF3592 domain-containing protein [Promicromonospora citrea]NNH53005.1 DUF3592 domain-containing protein [Promicromonospora citrea]
MSSRAPVVVAVVLLVMAAAFGTAAGFLGVRTAAFLADAGRAEGVVVGLDEDDDAYRAEVAYDVDGRTYELTDRVATNPPRHDVGERVTVLYDPADPADARLDARYGYWLETIFAVVAVALAGAGAAVLAARLRAGARDRLAATGERATGIVTAVRTSDRVTVNGRPRTVTTVSWRHPFAGERTLTEVTWGGGHAVGDQVNLRYDAARPARAVVEPPVGGPED